MNPLTPHEQQQVDKATQEGSEGCCESEAYGYVYGFPAGVDFALQHLFAGRMERFAEWIGNRYEKWGSGWVGIHNDSCTTEELIAKYQEYLKQQQNESL